MKPTWKVILYLLIGWAMATSAGFYTFIFYRLYHDGGIFLSEPVVWVNKAELGQAILICVLTVVGIIFLVRDAFRRRRFE